MGESIGSDKNRYHRRWNCASALLQGITYYRGKNSNDAIGILNWSINGYTPGDIEVVSTFDIDQRKVGKDVHDAIFERPNCTKKFVDHMSRAGVTVSMGKILDGFAEHMKNYEPDYTFLLCDQKEPTRGDVVEILKDSGTEVLLNYLPVGSEHATRFYAECAVEAGVSFINNIPVFIASDPFWADQFKSRKIPLIGDDIKSQMGATIVHRALTNLFEKRGVRLEKTYQLNTGGNTDFLNMLDRERVQQKRNPKQPQFSPLCAKSSKTAAYILPPATMCHGWMTRKSVLFEWKGGFSAICP